METEMRKEPPSREYVMSLLSYDSHTGAFTWKFKKSRKILAGQPAGYTNDRGYVVIRFNGNPYLAHRLAWLIENGEWPKEVIDHINGDKSDNRISNLRACSVHENACNSRMYRTNTSGVKGVYWSARDLAWHSTVGFEGRRVFVGLFKNLEDAKRETMNLRARLHGEFANHGEAN